VKDHVPTKIVTLKVRLGDGEHVNPAVHLFQEGEKSGQECPALRGREAAVGDTRQKKKSVTCGPPPAAAA